MAIRVGTSGAGTTPQLTSREETNARRSAAAASAGGAASASAYSANRRYAGLKKQLQASAEQSRLDRNQQAQLAEFKANVDLTRDAGQAKSNLTRDALRAKYSQQGQKLAFQLEQAGLDREFEQGQQTSEGLGQQAPLDAQGDNVTVNMATGGKMTTFPQYRDGFPVIQSEEDARRFPGQTARFPDGKLRRIPDDYGM